MYTFGSSYPVPLHRDYPLGPSVKTVKTIDKFLCIVGYPYEPLFQAPLDHGSAAAPADTLSDHLLICENGFAVLAPVDGGMFAVNKSLFIELEEEPLVPFVVIDAASLDLSSLVIAVTGPF